MVYHSVKACRCFLCTYQLVVLDRQHFKKKNNDSHNFLNIHFIHISLNLLQSYDVTYIEDERRERKKENHKHTMNTCSHNNYLPTKCEQLVVWNIGREGKLKSVSHKYLHVLIQELVSATKLHDANYWIHCWILQKLYIAKWQSLY